MVTGEVACEEKKTCYYTLEGGIDNTAYLFECMARHGGRVDCEMAETRPPVVGREVVILSTATIRQSEMMTLAWTSWKPPATDDMSNPRPRPVTPSPHLPISLQTIITTTVPFLNFVVSSPPFSL
jgi:hypothetical protein